MAEGVKKVFIDGEAGTTGLEVRNRLAKRSDVELITLNEADRKDAKARAKAFSAADAAILCLPDAAAIEAVDLCGDSQCVLIDASTAHRINPEWAYGFPELNSEQRSKITSAKRIANPGCYATGFIALTHPLTSAGVLRPDASLVCSAISGYSGGGKALMGVFEGEEPHEPWGAYGFALAHKHLPEMQCFSGLTEPPIFLPAVGDFAQGVPNANPNPNPNPTPSPNPNPIPNPDPNSNPSPDPNPNPNPDPNPNPNPNPNPKTLILTLP